MITEQGRIVRPLGAFERTIDFYMHRNPVQFSLVAELDGRVSPASAAAALAVLRDRHPLLGVAVDRTAPRAVFRTAGDAIPVEVAAAGTPWRSVVAAEQTRPIPPAPGPLARAVLVPRETGCAVVLTFAHQIADGVGGLRALLDLVAILGGAPPAPAAGGVPETQEDLLARVGGTADAAGAATDGAFPENDARMNAAGELVPFAGRVPHVDALALDRGPTARLVERARAEGASVHAALCAAAATVFHRRGREFVRVLSPVDLRRAAGLPDDVAVRFTGARTASVAGDARGFWALARAARASLVRQRAPHALVAGSAALAERPPAGPGDAEAMMAAATAADVQITNLGAVDPDGPGPDGLTALWGPAQITQLSGEHVLGVVTSGGRLRMTELTHDPVAAFVPDMAAVLAEACAAGTAP
ncbi:peptide synthetase [Actinomadura sp. WMMB 499]|uniref:phthiocerol/phthiodiolone dimycocerosyl transferase family protein n=1 Tax=Actinomadura sp. WMMB 499 TaxID=1219491 RepID=UPI001244D694|nr:peptide synthetase [Actinomadura sp. WMMB 499]QFG22311.1 peptide synthetase [Actinomadura sp. WMMB 499]